MTTEQPNINGKNKFYTPVNWFKSLKIAVTGLYLIIKNERNFRIQLAIAFLVGLTGIFFDIAHQDWINLGLLVGLVLISEAFNSVIEALADTISGEYRVNIKYAKDVAAGAVLISTCASVIAGSMIMVPYLIKWLSSYGILK
jgi:diacylglycerol kinase